MLGEEFSFPTVMGDKVRLRVVQSAAPLNHDQRVRLQVAARELRLGVAWHFEPILRAVLALHDMLRGRDPIFAASNLDARAESQATLDFILDELEQSLASGRLLVVDGAFPLLAIPPEPELIARERAPEFEAPPLPPIARGTRADKLTFFEVRFVDEVGQAIGGLELELSAGEVTETLPTNPAGVSSLEDVASMSGSVSVVDINKLAQIVEPRWERVRSGKQPTGVNTTSFPMTGTQIQDVGLKPAVPNTVVITPPVGRLFAELWDKSGTVRLDACEYSISGPMPFTGTTDAMGRLLHDDVLPGDYELTLQVDVNQAIGSRATPPSIEPELKAFRTQLVVLAPLEAAPEVRLLGTLRMVHLACARGMLFETNKSFLLPTALDCLKELRKLYEDSDPSDLLIVGHTDTTAGPSTNDPLSLERAESVIAYLKDDVDAWLARFSSSIAESKRWGDGEDQHMLRAQPDFPTKAPDEDSARWFQRTRGLKVDGIVGPETRSHLIREYMAMDGASLAAAELDISATAHGCGENFPLNETGQSLDEAPEDDREDLLDRRVELFFFNHEFGIEPAPAGKNSGPGSAEYPQWRKRAQQTREFVVAREGDSSQVHVQLLSEDAAQVLGACPFKLELPDATFEGTTDSAGLLGPFDAPPGDHQLRVEVSDSSFEIQAPTTTKRQGARVLLVKDASIEPDEVDEEEPTDFLELELTDPQGGTLAGEPFEVILADGSSRSGVLDQNGFARIEGVAPGTARVTFPRLHLDRPRAVVAA